MSKLQQYSYSDVKEQSHSLWKYSFTFTLSAFMVYDYYQ